MDALYDLIRVANLVLSIGLLYVVNMRVVRDWPRFTRRERVVRVHLNAYLAMLAYGTAEVLAMDTPPGLRVLFLLAVHCSFAGGLWATRRDPVR